MQRPRCPHEPSRSRRATTDADYEAWRRCGSRSSPTSGTPSVADAQGRATSPERLLLLARERRDRRRAPGLADRAESAGAGSAIPRVLPEHRRRGIGSALLHRAGRPRRPASGCRGSARPSTTRARSRSPDAFGFAEVNHEVEQTCVLGRPRRPSPDAVPGRRGRHRAERPGLWEESFERFGREATGDFAARHSARGQPERWATVWLGDPMFLAVHDGEVVGCAGLSADADAADRAENALTAVRRDWRGRGLAVHLKLRRPRLGRRARDRRGLHLDPGRQRRDARPQHAPRATPPRGAARWWRATCRSTSVARRSQRPPPTAPRADVPSSLRGAGHRRPADRPARGRARTGGTQRGAAPPQEPHQRAARAPRLRVRTVVRRLEHPWDVQQAPGGRLLVSERDRARISVVRHGKRRTLADLARAGVGLGRDRADVAGRRRRLPHGLGLPRQHDGRQPRAGQPLARRPEVEEAQPPSHRPRRAALHLRTARRLSAAARPAGATRSSSAQGTPPSAPTRATSTPSAARCCASTVVRAHRWRGNPFSDAASPTPVGVDLRPPQRAGPRPARGRDVVVGGAGQLSRRRGQPARPWRRLRLEPGAGLRRVRADDRPVVARHAARGRLVVRRPDRSPRRERRGCTAPSGAAWRAPWPSPP